MPGPWQKLAGSPFPQSGAEKQATCRGVEVACSSEILAVFARKRFYSCDSSIAGSNCQ